MLLPDTTALSNIYDPEIKQEFLFLSGGINGLPALSWTQKCECRIIFYVCVRYTCLSWEK